MSNRKQSTPWIAAAAVAVVVLALTVIPVSYTKTVSHDVALNLSGDGLEMTEVGAVADELKAQLGADAVMVKAVNKNGGMEYRLEANVPTGSAKNPSLVANAFANTLTADGYTASAEVTPVKEQVSGSVYAMATNREIRISVDGKSDAELEAEIRQALLDAGATSAEVNVRSNGDDTREITVNVEHESDDPDAPSPGDVSLTLTKDGKDLMDTGSAEKASCRQMVKMDGDGNRTVVVEVNNGTDTYRAEVTGAADDAALAAEVESQLRAQGLDATCTASDGRVDVQFN